MEHDEFNAPEAPAAPPRKLPPPVGVFPASVIEARKLRNKAARKNSGGPEFIGECGKHGETLYDTETGACFSCLQGLLDSKIPPLLAYRTAGATKYPATCEVHGETLFNAQTNRCIACHAGLVGNSDRAEARKAGKKTFPQPCDRCGETTGHYVSNGLCSACFTTAGAPRREGSGDTSRADARREGRTEYDADCADCGPTAHFVTNGKCAVCYTAMGTPRKRKIKT